MRKWCRWTRNGARSKTSARRSGGARARRGSCAPTFPAEYGGGGGDFRHEAVIYEELGRRGLSGFGQGVHSIAAHYLLNHGTAEQRQRFLPRLARGELIGAIGISEPGAGSDMKGIRTRAERDGDHYVVHGSKIFISNGMLAGLIALVVRTDPAPGSQSLSLLMVETADLAGFRVGRVLDKMGMHAQDTAELFFDGARIPAANLLGGVPGQGMYQLMSDLPYERILIAVSGVAAMEGALAATLAYTKERRAFGQSIFEFQNSKFRLAEIGHHGARGPGLRRRLHQPGHCRHARYRDRVHGQVVDHGHAATGAGRVRAAAWRLRLHERIPGVPHVCRQPRAAHLRRHQRDHERDHRARPVSAIDPVCVQLC